MIYSQKNKKKIGMNTFCPFHDDDKETEIKATKSLSYIIPMTLAEFHVERSLLVYLTMISRNLLFLPFQFLGGIGNSQQFKYCFSIIVCTALTFAIPYSLGFSLNSGLTMLRKQSYYKLWAMYTLFFIVLRHLIKIHRHTHKIIRGAIRQNRFLLIPILLHTLSNLMIFGTYNIYIGTYLAGQYGKTGLFISACLHIQAVIAKKYLPKILEIPPQFNEPTNRMVLIFSIAHHLATGKRGPVITLLAFEYGFAFARFFLTSLTEDAGKVYKTLKDGANYAFYQFVHNDATFDESLIANVPIEVFTVITLFLFTQGTNRYKMIIAGVVAAFAVIGTGIVTLFAPSERPVIKVAKKEKKDKAEKPEDQPATEKADTKEEKVEKDEKDENTEKKKSD
ncbi:hypothetical protein TRFO_09901 [Tritrichomonas foetus]|uniref:Uncharacterized protein n=1 Tax=Tritrichomonas foetus TaxID=1144522 RepID=A0A1J4JGD6_9EUKA|nr:hypothetical protein TRFO_09901 [Tritrichomonas foetus]|eukprot:OHS96517.1 hypothetical protein TRFO_09901 [Tritrichomonas foetus]